METLHIATLVGKLRQPAAPSPSTGAPTPAADQLLLPPPLLPDQIDLLPEQAAHALRLARLRKWGELKRVHTAWQQLHCDLVHDEATDTWGYALRERFEGLLQPPECPACEQDVPLSEAETDEALAQMQQRLWGEWNVRYVAACRRETDRQLAYQVPTLATAVQVGQAAWSRGEQLLAQMAPPRPFALTPDSEKVFNLLTWYFAGREDKFLELAEALDVEHPSLHKGLILLGPMGTGKTLLLRAFQQNPNRPYGMVTAKKVELAFHSGEAAQQQQDVFCGKNGRALCVDDVCTEQALVSDYGNKESPLARLILDRYDRYQQGRLPRWATHFSSNSPLYRLADTPRDMPSWQERYGDRATDRLHELCNIIPLEGESRRC